MRNWAYVSGPLTAVWLIAAFLVPSGVPKGILLGLTAVSLEATVVFIVLARRQADG
jgi:hypothetical protein